jgi:hypothetical protein
LILTIFVLRNVLAMVSTKDEEIEKLIVDWRFRKIAGHGF